MKKLLSILLALTLVASTATITEAKTLDETLEELNKTTDKIKDYLKGTEDTSISDITNQESDSGASVKYETPVIKEVRNGIAAKSYYMFMENDKSSVYVEWQFCDSKGNVKESGVTVGDEVDVRNVDAGTYYFRVRYRSSRSDDENTYLSDWSKKYWFITDPVIDNTVARKTLKKNSVKLHWNKVPGATKYLIYISTDKGNTYKKLGSTKKNSYTVKKYKGKNISFSNTKYLKVYAVTEKGGKTIKSESDAYIVCRVIG